MSKEFDLIVIGGGPGGYVGAIRGAQLGQSVAIVEIRKTLGGTCLNVGCIPSKALLDSSEHYFQAKNDFKVHGLNIKGLSIDFKQMIQRKNDVVTQTTGGIDFLMKKNKIQRFYGEGSFVDGNTIQIKDGKSVETIKGKSILIATGSETTPLPPVPFDGKQIISSDEALSLSKIPKSMSIVGGGVIGVEMGSIFARLGTKVAIVEFMDRLLPTMDKQLGKTLERSLKKLDMTFHFKTKVTGFKKTKSSVELNAEDKKGESVSIKSDLVLVAIGRRPFTKGLGLDKISVSLDERGRVPVDSNYQTKAAGVYAIGDVIEGPMLAHKASEEAAVCIEKIAGQKPHLNYQAIPGVVYTWPEVASVGYTEEELNEKKIAFKKGSFPFKASGRARAAEESEGFVKVLADKETDEVLGVHMIGPRVSDMIGEGVLAIEYRASAEDLGSIVHAHPTFSEALKEAGLGATANRAIHI